MANLFVTGGAGFIGTNFVRYWNERYPDDEVVVYDALTYAGNAENLDGLSAELVVGDICDTENVENILVSRKIDTIVHFAAESHVDRSISGPDAFVQTNVMGTHSLLKAAKKVWLDTGSSSAHRFHHVSTDEVFGSLGPNDPAFHEKSVYEPNSPYSASKAGSDHLVRAYHHTYGLAVTTSNCSNNYGPYQYPEKLIPLFIINALNGKNLPVYGDGNNVRDWLHVEDHCLGIDLVLKKGRVGDTYNIGGGQELRNLEVVEKICAGIDQAFADDLSLAQQFPLAPAAKGRSSRELITFVEDRKGHDRRYAIDERKVRSELGYTPQRDFSEGFQQTLSWYLSNVDWWMDLMKRHHAS